FVWTSHLTGVRSAALHSGFDWTNSRVGAQQKGLKRWLGWGAEMARLLCPGSIIKVKFTERSHASEKRRTISGALFRTVRWSRWHDTWRISRPKKWNIARGKS